MAILVNISCKLDRVSLIYTDTFNNIIHPKSFIYLTKKYNNNINIKKIQIRINPIIIIKWFQTSGLHSPPRTNGRSDSASGLLCETCSRDSRFDRHLLKMSLTQIPKKEVKLKKLSSQQFVCSKIKFLVPKRLQNRIFRIKNNTFFKKLTSATNRMCFSTGWYQVRVIGRRFVSTVEYFKFASLNIWIYNRF